MHTLSIPYSGGALGAILDLPQSRARAVVVLAHGSSAQGKDYPLLALLAGKLAANGIACLRFDFPFAAQGKTTPNGDAVLDKTFISALETARARFPDIPLIAAGKSLGARAAARVTITLARRLSAAANAVGTSAAGKGTKAPDGVLFVTYPLHPAGQTGFSRETPAARCPVPSLFIQGTRDPFADLPSLREFVSVVPRASLHIVEGGDHALRGCANFEAAIEECARQIGSWVKTPR